MQFCIAGTVHLAHAAFADRRGDLVDAETGTWSEGQTAGLYRRSDRADGIGPRLRTPVGRGRHSLTQSLVYTPGGMPHERSAAEHNRALALARETNGVTNVVGHLIVQQE